MGDPLIRLVNDAQTELGLPISNSVIRSLDNSARQLGGLATRAGRLLLRAHNWSFLAREWRITLLPPVTDTGGVTLGNFTITGLQGATLNQLQVGRMVVQGDGIAPYTRLTGVDLAAATATIDQPATETNSAASLSFVVDTFPEPSDYFKPVNETHWDRGQHWEMQGPLSPQEDQWLRSGVVSSGPRRKYRSIAHALRIWPPPANSDEANTPIVSEYLSQNWVVSAAGVGQDRFLADQDACLFDDGLMVLGMKMLFFSIKGFSIDDLEQQWKFAVREAMATDGPRRTLSMGARTWGQLLTTAVVPDGNWRGTP